MAATASTGRWGKPGPHSPGACRYCGSRTGDPCQRAVCLACDTPQCWGLSGKCRVCLVGLFTDTNHSHGGTLTCGYKCDNPAVAEVPRVLHACRFCLPRVTRRWQGRTIRLADEIAAAVATLGQSRGVPQYRRMTWYAT
uniref:hypothetical protein n=1 Tax=Nonomuraea sp. CA-251285 TaxID=3240002 RepID=UPI003F499BF0